MKKFLWAVSTLIIGAMIFAACSTAPKPVVETEEPPLNAIATIAASSAQTTFIYAPPVEGVEVESESPYRY